MGFPRSFPRAIAYASKDRGGIGLHLCGTDQGLHKVLQLIKHTRTRTSIGQVYNIVTQHYQLMAGLSHLILQDTRPIPWSTALWYDNLHQFLHSIQGQIIIQNPWIPTQQRKNDRHIMDDILGLKLSRQHTSSYKASDYSSEYQCYWKSCTTQDSRCSQLQLRDPTRDIGTTTLSTIPVHSNGRNKLFLDQPHGKDGAK